MPRTTLLAIVGVALALAVHSVVPTGDNGDRGNATAAVAQATRILRQRIDRRLVYPGEKPWNVWNAPLGYTGTSSDRCGAYHTDIFERRDETFARSTAKEGRTDVDNALKNAVQRQRPWQGRMDYTLNGLMYSWVVEWLIGGGPEAQHTEAELLAYVRFLTNLQDHLRALKACMEFHAEGAQKQLDEHATDATKAGPLKELHTYFNNYRLIYADMEEVVDDSITEIRAGLPPGMGDAEASVTATFFAGK